jgi:hypothetical protein
MPSPFDKVTKSQELRNTLANKPILAQQALENQNIFQSELTRLSLDEKNMEMADKRAAQDATSQFNAMASKARSPEDVTRIAKEFVSQNPRYSEQIYKSADQVSQMFNRESTAKGASLSMQIQEQQLESVKRENKIAEQFYQMDVDVRTQQTSLQKLKLEQENANLKIQKQEQLGAYSDSVNSVVSRINTSGIKDENKRKALEAYMASYTSRYAKSKESQLPDEVFASADSLVRSLGPVASFQSSYAILQNDFNQRNQEKLIEIQKKHGTKYQDWAAKQEAGASIRLESFLLDQLKNNTDIGKELLNDVTTSEIASDLIRLSELKQSYSDFEGVLVNNYNKEQGRLVDGGDIIIEAGAKALQGRMTNAINQFSASADAKKKVHEEQARILRMRKTQAEIGNLDDRQAQERRRAEIGVIEQEYKTKSIALIDAEKALNEEGGNTGSNRDRRKQLQEEVDKIKDRWNKLINEPIQLQSSSSPSPTDAPKELDF